MAVLRTDAIYGNSVYSVSYIEQKVRGQGQYVVELREDGKITDRWTYGHTDKVDGLVRYAHVVKCLYSKTLRGIAHNDAVLTTEPGKYEENPEE